MAHGFDWSDIRVLKRSLLQILRRLSSWTSQRSDGVKSFQPAKYERDFAGADGSSILSYPGLLAAQCYVRKPERGT
jgi:hypothetical protein